ncbi:hypothetical protein BJ742DRAFT_834625 [Cladochytrium replicatum]|nr:hypothetical protein BJ742DRAFT_834625 [Cladochytrium replicatum]
MWFKRSVPAALAASSTNPSVSPSPGVVSNSNTGGNEGGLSGGAIAGIAVAALVLLLAFPGYVLYKKVAGKGGKHTRNRGKGQHNQQPRSVGADQQAGQPNGLLGQDSPNKFPQPDPQLTQQISNQQLQYPAQAPLPAQGFQATPGVSGHDAVYHHIMNPNNAYQVQGFQGTPGVGGQEAAFHHIANPNNAYIGPEFGAGGAAAAPAVVAVPPEIVMAVSSALIGASGGGFFIACGASLLEAVRNARSKRLEVEQLKSKLRVEFLSNAENQSGVRASSEAEFQAWWDASVRSYVGGTANSMGYLPLQLPENEKLQLPPQDLALVDFVYVHPQSGEFLVWSPIASA